MKYEPVVIVSAVRTPLGGFQGVLAPVRAAELGATAIRGAIARAGIEAADVGEVIMGCVLPAGQGQAPARQASLGAGIPASVGCTTVNKMCGSGMKAAMFAHDLLRAESIDIAIAGGMESMSNAPYLLPKARAGLRMGHVQMLDHMFLDGLEDAYDTGRLMGAFAEATATRFKFSRQEQDDFAIESVTRARNAIDDGRFENEIEAVVFSTRKAEVTVRVDELPQRADTQKIPQLRPAFEKDGTVTAANSSSISDGAAALVMMRASEAERRHLKPLVRVLGHNTHAHAPEWFTTAPIEAIRGLLKKIGSSADAIDLYEINEAFAVVTMAAMRELNLPHERVNVHGGACALGHPIGASGARIIATLIHAMQLHDKQLGVASLCIGGGEATAIALQKC